MVTNGWIHLLASDAHDINGRSHKLRDGFEFLNAVVGRDVVNHLNSNAVKMLAGSIMDDSRSGAQRQASRWSITTIWRK